MSNFDNVAIKETKDSKKNVSETNSQDGTKIVHKEVENIARERRFCCHICGTTFVRKSKMNKHIRIHEGYRYICRIDMCYKLFKHKKSCKKHQLIHKEIPTCYSCGKAVRREENFERHSTKCFQKLGLEGQMSDEEFEQFE